MGKSSATILGEGERGPSWMFLLCPERDQACDGLGTTLELLPSNGAALVTTPQRFRPIPPNDCGARQDETGTPMSLFA
jgi:hypothetical protein